MFTNNDGVIELESEFPEEMSLKQAIRYSVEKHEFILEELLAGHVVVCDGGALTCALCVFQRRRYGGCMMCPVFAKAGSSCTFTPYGKMQEDRRKDGSFRVPHTRSEVKFLKALEADYA